MQQWVVEILHTFFTMKENEHCAGSDLQGSIRAVKPQDLQQAIDLEEEGKNLLGLFMLFISQMTVTVLLLKLQTLSARCTTKT